MADDAEKTWIAAEAARKAALRAAFRDKLLWGDQSVNAVCGLIKAFCVAMALSVAFERFGFPEELNTVLAALVTMPALALNPWAFFWRNLFIERADAAFDEFLRNYHRN